MDPARSPWPRRLVLVAALDSLASLLLALTGDLPLAPRQLDSLTVLVAQTAVVGALIASALKQEFQLLREHPTLLVPLGIYVTFLTLLALLALAPLLSGLMNSSESIDVPSIGLALSPLFVATLLGSVAHTTWTTVLAVQVARGESVDLVAGWRSVGRHYWRVLALSALCVVAMFAVVALYIALRPSGLLSGLILIAGGSLLLNLSTAALLPTAVTQGGALSATIVRGGRLSWKHARAWAAVLVLQMFVLGVVTRLEVTLGGPMRPGSNTHHKTATNIHGMWTGGTTAESYWLGDLMEMLEVESPQSVDLLLMLVLTLLAVLIKLRVARVLHENGEL